MTTTQCKICGALMLNGIHTGFKTQKEYLEWYYKAHKVMPADATGFSDLMFKKANP